MKLPNFTYGRTNVGNIEGIRLNILEVRRLGKNKIILFMENYEELKQIAINYLESRKKFLKEASKFEELHGNDNIIGRIGELIALKYLYNQGRVLSKSKNLVEKGFDLLSTNNEKISVKIITAENKKGQTTKLKMPWTEIIVISLTENYKVDRIGHITEKEFERGINENFVKSKEPYTNRKMLSDNNLFHKYGRLLKNDEVKLYL